MRKVIWSAMISLDGFYEAPGEGWEKIDWMRADEEWDAYAAELMSGADTLMFGRRTYEGFAEFWPTQEGEVARLLNILPKVVFSTTLSEATWRGSRIVRNNAEEEVAKLKAAAGKEIVILGSATFAATLTRHGLIDEYRVAVNPVVLSGGSPLFQDGAGRRNLRLLDTRVFRTGIVELRYAPAEE